MNTNLPQFVDYFRDGNTSLAIDFLNEQPEILSYADYDGDTLLHHSAVDGHVTIGDILLRFGLNLNLTNYQGETALHVACTFGNHDFVSFLLRKGAMVDLPNKQGYTALHKAVFGHIWAHRISYYLKTIETLINFGANVNARTNDGFSVLDLAKRHKYVDIHNLLIQFGAI